MPTHRGPTSFTSFVSFEERINRGHLAVAMINPNKIKPLSAGARGRTTNRKGGKEIIPDVFLARIQNDQCCTWLATCWLTSHTNKEHGTTLATM